MKHRHRLAQRQRQRPASSSRRAEVYEDEQPHSSAGKAKKRTAHQMRAEGGKTKPRLDKFRRGGRPRNRYDNGGPAGSLLHRLEAPMIREENSLRQVGSARALSAGYKTNCSAQRAPTRAAVASDPSVTMTAVWLTTAI